MAGSIKVGIIGAGANAKLRHIPGFQAIPGCEVAAVANRTMESGQKVAKEFKIPKVYDHWSKLLDQPDIDAVCIATWPYMHCPITVEALRKNKHVLCEARMAMNSREAHKMLEASHKHPRLIAQVVPAPFTFKVDQTIKELVASGFLGDLLAMEVRVLDKNFADTQSPLTWRQDRQLSGYNTMTMGIWYECLMRWVGEAKKVQAMSKVCVDKRPGPDGKTRFVKVPDHVDITCAFGCGAQAHLRFSSVTGLAPESEVWLFGSKGTLYLNADKMVLKGGQKGDKELREIPVPPEKQGQWQVEKDFIDSIRDHKPVTLTDFATGVKYMEWTEAVIKSAKKGKAIKLPL